MIDFQHNYKLLPSEPPRQQYTTILENNVQTNCLLVVYNMLDIADFLGRYPSLHKIKIEICKTCGYILYQNNCVPLKRTNNIDEK
jgi:hypothetical protein